MKHVNYNQYAKGHTFSITNKIIKRSFDIFFSIFVILFILMWLVPLIAVFIKLSSPGPIITVKVRTGRKRKPILVFSFRTTPMDSGPTDFTTIGKFLYITNLDRMPEYLSVLFGDLSVVGVSQLPFVDDSDETSWQSNPMRYEVKPGIASLAQLRGASTIENVIRYDNLYLANYSMWFDIKIMFALLSEMLRGKHSLRDKRIKNYRTIELENLPDDLFTIQNEPWSIELNNDIWSEELEEKNNHFSERTIDINTILAVAAGGGMLLGSILSSFIGIWGIVAGVLIGGIVGYLTQIFKKYEKVIHPKKSTSH